VVRFLAVSGFFVAISLVAAAVMWLGGSVANLLIPDAGARVWPYTAVGVAALAVAMLGAKWGLTLLQRLAARRRA
jgi:hypothetical protein